MNVFIKDGMYCVVQRDTYEAREKFIQRGYLIVGNKPQNTEEYKNYEVLSRMMMNAKYYGNKYDVNLPKNYKV